MRLLRSFERPFHSSGAAIPHLLGVPYLPLFDFLMLASFDSWMIFLKLHFGRIAIGVYLLTNWKVPHLIALEHPSYSDLSAYQLQALSQNRLGMRSHHHEPQAHLPTAHAPIERLPHH